MITAQKPTDAELESNQEKESNVIRMPSEGQRFKLLGNKFEVVKSQGTRFTAVIVKEYE